MDPRAEFTLPTSGLPRGHLTPRSSAIPAQFAAENLAVALSLAEAGLFVFPAEIGPNGDRWRKKPLIRNWQALATTDSEQIKQWWLHEFPNAVPGIELRRTDLVVVDPDRHGSADGVSAFDALVAACGDLQAHPTTLTPGGGRHHYFKQRPDRRCRNRRGSLPEGIDVRGDGGWIVAPGAIRPDGKRYQPADGAPPLATVFSSDSIPILPAWLATKMQDARMGTPFSTSLPIGDLAHHPSTSELGREATYARRALEGAAHDLSRTPIGTRNEALNAAAYRLGRMAARDWIDKASIIAALSEAAVSAGLDADEVQTTLASGLTAGLNHPAEDLLDRPQRHREGARGAQEERSWPCADEASSFQPEDEVGRLAALGTFEYEQVREAEAKRLKVRVGVLDAQVAKRRKTDEQPDRPGFLKSPTPWATTVSGADLLTELEQALTRHVKLGEHACSAIALWIVHCHAIGSAEIAPILAVESPEKRCGKTTLLSVIQTLVPKALTAANMSSAAVFRAVEEFQPTLIVDEADTFVTADKPELIGILNSSHVRSSAYVLRVVGDNHEVKVFSTWCAKAIALIGTLPSTLQDRSIVIRMRRKQKDETVHRLRLDRLAPLVELCSKCARWVADHLGELASADPATPAQLNDRAADNWRSLLAIADAAGGGWPAKGRAAAVTLSGLSQDEEDLSKGVTLLRDCRRVFEKTRASQLGAEVLVTNLCALDEAPWAEWRRGEKPITARGVAVLLKPFGIASRHSRAAREYHQADFADAWTRYLPAVPDLSVTSVTPLESNSNSDSPSVAVRSGGDT